MKRLLYLLGLLGILLGSCTSSDTPAAANAPIEAKIDSLLRTMTLAQKIGQTAMRGTSSRVKGVLSDELKQAVRNGEVGTVLNVIKPEFVDELQQIAVTESPQGIPLIFARDVIHGFKTIFPIPLGMAASWDTAVAYQSSRIAAEEATAIGLRWTFAPMLDISRDARWGRIAESAGEDPYLTSVMAKAMVKGFQGEGLDDPTSLAACAKHFVGYGAAIGGRDYNTVVIDESELRHVYLPPFKAAIDAGAPTIMAAFNDLNGVPASGNPFLLQQVLRDEWQFDGFVVSDWNGIPEMINHGYASDLAHAAELSAKAGMDMEMMTKAYQDHLKTLIEAGVIPESRLDFFVRNILRVKFRMGLFDQPYRRKQVDKAAYHPDHLAAAKEAAIKSSVLLHNKGVLPLAPTTRVALIGPMADAGRDQLGTWTFDGEGEQTVTPYDAFKQAGVKFRYAPGLAYSRDQAVRGFGGALAAAGRADVIVFVAGEEAILSGEAHSRADISLPGKQVELIRFLKKTNKPIVLVIMAGRPIAIQNLIDEVDAVLMMWHPGTMGGPALHEMLMGTREPEGRLPVSWPKTGGQEPYYYNHKSTGRPADSSSFVHIDDIPVGAWQSSLGNNSHYLDAGFTPQFPFGFGLSYSTFAYSNLRLSAESIGQNGRLIVSATVTNTGKRVSTAIPQLYIRDQVASLTRPVRELKGFQRIVLAPGEARNIEFELTADELAFVNAEMKRVVEPGIFQVWVGPDAASGLTGQFRVE